MRRVFRELWIASAAVTTAAQSVQLSILEQDIGRLRNDDVLSRELLLQSHGTAVCPHTHGSHSIKADQSILRAVANGDGLNLQKRRINGHRRPALNREMNRARVQRYGELIADFED